MEATEKVLERPVLKPKAKSAWRDALAGRSIRRRAGTPRAEEQKGRFDIVILGFELNAQTWDDATQRDGKGDELFVDYVLRLVDAAGTTLLDLHDRTKVMGDVNRQSGRVKAGSASASGGLRTGDELKGFLRVGEPNRVPSQVPRRIFGGELEAGKTGLVVVPSVWEFDPSPRVLQEWLNAVTEAAPEVAELVGAIATAAGKPDVAAIAEAAGLALPTVTQAVNAIVGKAESRPIGMVRDGERLVFNPVALALNFETASLVAATDFGRGLGIVPINFRDDPQLRGDCTLLVQVRKIELPAGTEDSPNV